MRRLAAASAALLCVTGCAALPTGGSVVTDSRQDRSAVLDEPYVRIIPVRPQDGWTPEQVVNGFMTAMANFDDDRSVLDSYLAPGVTWPDRARSTLQVHDDVDRPPVSAELNEGRTETQTTVQVSGRKLGEISPSGQYKADDKPSYIDQFRLTRVSADRWRIARSPGHRLLRRSDVDRAFRTINLYFFSPDKAVLVPDSVFLPLVDRENLPNQLVQSLLSGPTAWLGDAVVGAFPQGTRARVRLSDDVATVNLSREARKGRVDEMSAQLMWTLGQLTEVRKLRLEIDGKVQKPADGPEVQSIENWLHVGPDSPQEGTGKIPYLLDAQNRFSSLSSETTPFPSLRDHPLTRPAISLDAQHVAGVSGRELLVGEINTGSVVTVHTAAEGASLLRPTWDRYGSLWIVEAKGSSSKLWLLRAGESQAIEMSWDFGNVPVRALRVARDGVRAAALVVNGGKAEIHIGPIERMPNGVYRFGTFRPISAELASVRDLAWRDADTLAVLGTVGTSTTPAPYEVPISGGALRYIGGTLEGSPDTITAAPGKDTAILVGTTAGRREKKMCRQIVEEDPRFSTWDCSVTGSAPTYPG